MSSRRRRDDDELKIDPVYHALSRINGEINRMTKPELQYHLRSNDLDERGVKEVLRKRLKSYFRKQKLRNKPEVRDGAQYYPHLVVIDFEATCEERNPPDYLHEIIEFPAVLLDTAANTVVDEFHSHCRPTLNPVLSEFCTRLTGIDQSQVDGAPEFPQVFAQFETWLRDRQLLTPARKVAFVTDGSWDFSRFLNIQCCLSEIAYPKWAKKWINLKKVYGNFYKLSKPRMLDMLTNVGLEHEGRLHSGRDDARNLARVVQRMIMDGAAFQVNERLSGGQLQSITEKERQLLNSFEHVAAPPLKADDVSDDVTQHLDKLVL